MAYKLTREIGQHAEGWILHATSGQVKCCNLHCYFVLLIQGFACSTTRLNNSQYKYNLSPGPESGGESSDVGHGAVRSDGGLVVMVMAVVVFFCSSAACCALHRLHRCPLRVCTVY